MAMETSKGLKTQSFMLSAEDIEAITSAQNQEGYATRSEALRKLINDAVAYRALRSGLSQKVLPTLQAEVANTLHQLLEVRAKSNSLR